jgi:hypothetical protein
MERQNVLGVLGVAGATMAFALVLFGPWSVGISDDAKCITPKVLSPRFAAHGCEFTVKTGRASYQAGESPTVEVTAANPTDKAVEATAWISIMAGRVPSPLSRTLAMPQPVWKKSWSVSLKPGETKTARFDTDVKLAAKQNVTIMIGDKEQSVFMGTLPLNRVAAPKKAAAK